MTKRFFIKLPFILTIIFFVLPFFWFSAGEIDWGGDSSRLYYLDPFSYLQNHTLFGVSPSETGGPIQGFYSLPFILLLIILRSFLDPTSVVVLFHSVKLSCAFLFTYLAIFQLLKDEREKNLHIKVLASAIGGIFYALSPVITLGWDKAIFTHDQIYLNPVMFFLLLKFFEKGKFIYLSIMLLVSLLFSHNFSVGAAPAIFSFYPIMGAFLIVRQMYIVKGKLFINKLIIAIVIFFFLHAFHFVPTFIKFFEPGSDIHTNVFTEAGKFDRGLSYFLGVVRNVKLSNAIFSLPQLTEPNKILLIYTGVLPFVLIVSFLFKRNKLLIITTVFFLFSLFFVAANITSLGVEFYKTLFNIPGFSMFRNFFGQWNNVFFFLYALVFSIALMQILKNLKSGFKYYIPAHVVLLIIVTSTPFLKGDLINNTIWQSNGVKVLSVPDKDFLASIDYVKSIKQDSKFITLPLTDPSYQIISGTNGGAYVGPSTIAYLGGKKDFAGLGSFFHYRELLKEAIETDNIQLLKQIFAYLNIGYIYHNSDPQVYEKGFPIFPYQEALYFLPKTQMSYNKLISKLGVKKIAQFGTNYHIYKLDQKEYVPHIFAATVVISSNDTSAAFAIDKEQDRRKTFVQNDLHLKIGDRQDIYPAKQINPFEQLANNKHLHQHAPYISRKMNELLYPLVVLKEKFDVRSKEDISTFTDASLHMASKRVFELEKYGDEMSIGYEQSFIPFGDYYMTWYRSLLRYREAYSELHAFLVKAKNEKGEINAELVKADTQLRRHQAQLIEKISSLKKTEKEKTQIKKIVNKTITDISRLLSVPIFSTELNSYSVTIPDKKHGEYELLLENISQLDQESETAVLTLNNANYVLKSSSKSGELIKFSKVNLPSGVLNFSIAYSRQNLLENSELNRGKEILAQTLDAKPYTEEIIGYEPLKQYAITFEYKTNGNDFTFSFLDRKKTNRKNEMNNFFKKNLNSYDWRKEQTIIMSDMNATAGFIGFANNHSPSNATLSIRNMVVTQTQVPKLTFIKNTPGQIYTPKIAFQRISPVAYKVTVKDGVKPYVLVLSDTYDKDWRLVLNNSKPFNLKPSFHYFDGQIGEANARHEFPSFDFFVGWSDKFVADSNHYLVNKYANGWYVTPHDVNNKKDYDLYLIYNGQKPFYIGLGITIITLTLVLIFVIRSLYKIWSKR